MKYLVLLASLLGIPLLGQGETTPAPTPTSPHEIPPPPVQDYGAAFFKMILMLFALLAVVVLTVWIIKRWGHGRLGRFKDKQGIHILEKRILSPKTALYTIEVEGSRLLVVESQLEVRALHQWQVPPEEQN
jgi:flagellar biogenesis protein FliO